MSSARCQKADWSFFATAHGKGLVDGVGGTVKRTVWRRILHKRALMNSPKDFAVVARDACPNIHVLYIDASEMDSTKKELSDLWSQQTPRTIPNTRSYHYFTPVSSTHLQVGHISPFIDEVTVELKMVALLTTDTANQQNIDSDSDEPRFEQADYIDLEEADVIEKSVKSTEEEKIRVSDLMKGFEEVLSTKTFRLYGHTPSDGNCFFWAISSQLMRQGLQTYDQRQLRHMVCDYLINLPEKNHDELQPFIPGQDMAKYIYEMQKDETYIDHIVVEHTSRMLSGIPITIVTGQNKTVIGKPVLKQPVLYLGYIPELQHYVSVEPVPHSSIQEAEISEKYYAVDYIDRFYIGRILGERQHDLYRMKFLHQISRDGQDIFSWPKTDDIDRVFLRNIFYGPITLQGCTEFKVPNIKEIEDIFQNLFRG